MNMCKGIGWSLQYVNRSHDRKQPQFLKLYFRKYEIVLSLLDTSEALGGVPYGKPRS
jgi:hypothetical protein